MLNASASDSRAGLGTLKCRVGCAKSTAGSALPCAPVFNKAAKPNMAAAITAAATPTRAKAPLAMCGHSHQGRPHGKVPAFLILHGDYS
jgi:hypothetical protein